MTKIDTLPKTVQLERQRVVPRAARADIGRVGVRTSIGFERRDREQEAERKIYLQASQVAKEAVQFATLKARESNSFDMKRSELLGAAYNYQLEYIQSEEFGDLSTTEAKAHYVAVSLLAIPRVQQIADKKQSGEKLPAHMYDENKTFISQFNQQLVDAAEMMTRYERRGFERNFLTIAKHLHGLRPLEGEKLSQELSGVFRGMAAEFAVREALERRSATIDNLSFNIRRATTDEDKKGIDVVVAIPGTGTENRVDVKTSGSFRAKVRECHFSHEDEEKILKEGYFVKSRTPVPEGTIIESVLDAHRFGDTAAFTYDNIRSERALRAFVDHVSRREDE